MRSQTRWGRIVAEPPPSAGSRQRRDVLACPDFFLSCGTQNRGFSIIQFSPVRKGRIVA